MPILPRRKTGAVCARHGSRELSSFEKETQETSVRFRRSFGLPGWRPIRKTEKSLFASFSSEKEGSFLLILHRNAQHFLGITTNARQDLLREA
ncbi:MAG TPA: hypothetical protein VMA86_06915, partial [Acetobacteraceae bacterium]|nr:hypothetical protein [Acetobacteraceae bacterium]